jgi:hypothetical protein
MILVAVAVVLGAILLIKGGGVGFDETSNDLEIESGGEATEQVEQSTTTTEAAPATSVPASALKVVALNGAGINGYAGKAQQFLSVAGYTATTAITAAQQAPTTTVYFAPGFQADAEAVAALFGLQPTSVQAMPTPGTGLAKDPAEFPADTNVAVVLGPDVESTVEGAAGGAAAGGSTTTVVGGSTTTITGASSTTIAGSSAGAGTDSSDTTGN